MVRTLLVDDSDVFRGLLRQLLARRYRYIRLSEASSLGEGLRLAQRIRPDVVFADIRLGDGNGLELARSLGQTLPYAHVCMVTAYDLPEYREAAEAAGARHFIAKGQTTLDHISVVVDGAMDGRVPVVVLDGDARRRATLARAIAARWPVLIVLEARSIEEALPMISYARPVVVLAPLAYLLSQPTALARATREAWPGAKLVALATSPDAASREAAFDAGAAYVGPAGRAAAGLAPLVAEALHACGERIAGGVPGGRVSP